MMGSIEIGPEKNPADENALLNSAAFAASTSFFFTGSGFSQDAQQYTSKEYR